MPYTTVTEPGVVTSVESADEIRVHIAESPVVIDVTEPTPIHVSTPNQGMQGPQGPPGFQDPFRETKTFALNGEIKVDVDGKDFIPGFYMDKDNSVSQTITLVDSIAHIVSGTAVVLKLMRNENDEPGWDNIGVDIFPGRFQGPPVAIGQGDLIRIVVTDAVGVPMNLTFTLVFEIVA